MQARNRASVVLFLLLPGLISCASYTAKYDKAIAAYEKGDAEAWQKLYRKKASKEGSKDQLLALWELGAFEQTTGDVEASLQDFLKAEQVSQAIEEAAVVSAGDTSRTAGSLFTNDTVLEYKGHAYEKVMASTLAAMDYLELGKLEDAQVELRRAEEYQQAERERHAKELEKKKQKKDGDEQEQNAQQIIANNRTAIDKAYSEMDAYVRGVRNSYENAWTYYLAATVFEASGRDGLNDAHLYAKQAYELAPEAEAVREAYLDITREWDPEQYEQLASELADPLDTPSENDGLLVVIYASGTVPRKQAVEISIPFFYDRQTNLLNMAWPVYQKLPTDSSGLVFSCNGQSYHTDRLVHVGKLAVKALKEEMPAIMTRAVARAITKFVTEHEAGKKNGWAGLIASIANVATNRADLRSWLSLPKVVQAQRLHVPPGEYDMTTNDPVVPLIHAVVETGKTTLVYVRSDGRMGHAFSTVIGGRS